MASGSECKSKELESDDPPFRSLKSLRRKINSLKDKFDSFLDQIRRNVDILAISETKLDESFLEEPFKIEGFTTPFGRDRNEFGGWNCEKFSTENINTSCSLIQNRLEEFLLICINTLNIFAPCKKNYCRGNIRHSYT